MSGIAVNRSRFSAGRLLAAAAGLLLAFCAWLVLGPLPADLLDRSRFERLTVLDRNGEVLFEGLSASGTRSSWVEPEEIPRNVVSAIVAVEDHRFFSHPGIDPVAIGRAAWRNFAAGGIVEGGSTITQQTAKLLLADTDRGGSRLARKTREAIVAVRLERELSKREIVSLYLNLAPFGNQYVGVGQAARGYFGIEPRYLTDAQAALLAGLPQRPSALDPRRHFGRATERQAHVLRRMREESLISASRLESALAETVRIDDGGADLLAPHVVARLQHELRGRGIPVVRTTLDARLQRQVRGILAAHRARLEEHNANNLAVAVLDNRSGEWLAWEGSGDYFDEKHGGAIDGVRVARQPGSALKPFAYAAAFDAGLDAATVLADVESSFSTAEDGIVYVPRNYDGAFHGPVRARAALAGSLNVPAVSLLSRIGVPRFLGVLRGAGISTLDRSADYYGLGAVLGGGEVRLDELVAAYAMLARGGLAVTPKLLLDEVGQPPPADVGQPPPADVGQPPSAARAGRAIRVISPESAFLVADILADDQARAFAFGRGGSLEFAFPVAAKTGTSQAYRDNWALGFTPEVTVGVWVGNFDRSELRQSSGVTGAAPIFHDVMIAARELVPGAEEMRAPASLESRAICLLSGMDPTAACPRVGREWLRAGERARCTWHRLVHAAGPSGDLQSRVAVAWPAELRAWADEQGLESAAPARPIAVAARAPESPSISIVHPPDGAVYLIDPTLRREYQTVALRAAVDGARRPLTWSVNGREVESARSDREVDLPLTPGEMRIEVRDERGRHHHVTIRVR